MLGTLMWLMEARDDQSFQQECKEFLGNRHLEPSVVTITFSSKFVRCRPSGGCVEPVELLTRLTQKPLGWELEYSGSKLARRDEVGLIGSREEAMDANGSVPLSLKEERLVYWLILEIVWDKEGKEDTREKGRGEKRPLAVQLEADRSDACLLGAGRTGRPGLGCGGAGRLPWQHGAA